MNEKKETGWFAKHAEAEAKKDVIPYSERAGNIVGVVIGVLVILFFVAHQTRSTGFFTSKFDTLEMILFYGPLILGFVSTALKGLFGRKNVVRPFDVSMGVFVAIAIAYLYMVFPFDFAHLAEVLPSFLRFLLQWISNDVAKVMMIIGILVAPIIAIYTAVLYMLVQKELSKST